MAIADDVIHEQGIGSSVPVLTVPAPYIACYSEYTTLWIQPWAGHVCILIVWWIYCAGLGV